MDELLRFLKVYEIWIYLLLGLVAIIYLRKFLLALNDWRGATFGLEKDNAHWRLNESTSVIILVLLLAAGEFLLVSFITPTYPGLQVLSTPTLNPLATATLPLPTQSNMLEQGGSIDLQGTPMPGNRGSTGSAGCIEGELEFLYPEIGKEVSGPLVLKGIVNVSNFGFYKYEFSQPGMDTWITIAAGNTLPQPPNYELGPWDTSLLFPGDYRLRLIVIDHQGNPQTPCEINIRVTAP